MRKLLIVSPHFPPLNAPDLQRVRMSLPYYRDHGWEPVVLTIDDRWQNGTREPELLQTVPADIRVIRVQALPIALTRKLGVGNVGLRSWFHLLLAGAKLLREEKFDLVFFSNTQFITFPLGRLWRHWFGVPYVLDLQDPWRTDYYERRNSRRPPGGWKYQGARFVAWLLEGWSFKCASGVMSVSPDYLDDLRARYRWFSFTPAEVIRFGASRADLTAASQLPPLPWLISQASDELHLLYTGASGPVMPHSLRVLFDGLRLYREQKPERAARLRFHFLGTSYVAPGEGKPSVLPVAEQCGVADQVREIPHRLGHLECIQLQRNADALLLPGSSDLAYSPSKIYPYYLAERPILALVFKQSVMESVLNELSCAFLARFDENGPKSEAHVLIGRFFDLLIDGQIQNAAPRRNETYFETHFLASALTRQQCHLFNRSTTHADTFDGLGPVL